MPGRSKRRQGTWKHLKSRGQILSILFGKQKCRKNPNWRCGASNLSKLVSCIFSGLYMALPFSYSSVCWFARGVTQIDVTLMHVVAHIQLPTLSCFETLRLMGRQLSVTEFALMASLTYEMPQRVVEAPKRDPFHHSISIRNAPPSWYISDLRVREFTVIWLEQSKVTLLRGCWVMAFFPGRQACSHYFPKWRVEGRPENARKKDWASFLMLTSVPQPCQGDGWEGTRDHHIIFTDVNLPRLSAVSIGVFEGWMHLSFLQEVPLGLLLKQHTKGRFHELCHWDL